MNTRMKIVVLESVAVGLAISCVCIMGVYMYKRNYCMNKVHPPQQPSIICNKAHGEHVIEDTSKQDLKKKEKPIELDVSDAANLNIISNNFINQGLVDKETAAKNKKKEEMQKEVRKRLNVQTEKEKKEVKQKNKKAVEFIASSPNFQNSMNKESARNSNISQSEQKKSKARQALMETLSIPANTQQDSDIVQNSDITRINSEQKFDSLLPFNDHPQESDALFRMKETNEPLLQDEPEPFLFEDESNILEPVKESNKSISEEESNILEPVKEHNIPQPMKEYTPVIVKETITPMVAYSKPLPKIQYSKPLSEKKDNLQYSVKESNKSLSEEESKMPRIDEVSSTSLSEEGPYITQNHDDSTKEVNMPLNLQQDSNIVQNSNDPLQQFDVSNTYEREPSLSQNLRKKSDTSIDFKKSPTSSLDFERKSDLSLDFKDKPNSLQN